MDCKKHVLCNEKKNDKRLIQQNNPTGNKNMNSQYLCYCFLVLMFEDTFENKYGIISSA